MNIVTGSFGYIGKYITRELLACGKEVRTITTHPEKPNPFGSAVTVEPYNFDRPDELTASLRGATTLYNTYWIRFEHAGATFARAVENTQILFECARRAGIRKIVHISVTNASVDSSLPYYRGKALQEQALVASGVPFSIVRPTLVFGQEDILVNNIAWLIRKIPFFTIFGSGKYRLQPIFVEDLASIAVATGSESDDVTLDAIGPEIYGFEEFVRLMIDCIRPGVKIVHVPPAVGIAVGRLIGLALGDIILTRDELRGLMDDLLISSQPPNGSKRFSQWLSDNRDTLGLKYSSELARHFRWRPS